MTNQLVAILVGILTLVIGLVLADVVLEAVTVPSERAESFAGAPAVNNLIPVVYFTVVVAIGIGMIGSGALGMMGRGLVANR